MLFRITIYYKNSDIFGRGVYCKMILVSPDKRLLVQEKKNSYIIGIGDNKNNSYDIGTSNNKNNFEEILYDIKKKDLRKEKAFEIERLSEWPNPVFENYME